MPNYITCCFVIVCVFSVLLVSVKFLYIFVKPYSFFNESTGLLLDMRRLFIMTHPDTRRMISTSARIKYQGDKAIFSEKFFSHAEAA